MTVTIDDIRAWTGERFSEVREEGGLSIVGLLHYSANGTETPIHVVTSKGPSDRWNADAVATMMDAIASRHARGLNGVQQFQLIATFGASGKPSAWLPFQRVGGLTHGPLPGGGLATEAANGQGNLAQGMRLSELLIQGSFAQNRDNAQTQAAIIDRSMRRQAELERQNGELLIAIKNMVAEHLREGHDRRMAALSAARMAEFQKQAMTLAPALINMMAGKEVFPLAQADTATLDTIAGWASPDDIRMITAGLAAKPGGAEIATILTDRFNEFHKRKSAEAAEEQRLVRNLGDRTYEEAERDAGGEAIRVLRGEPLPERRALTNSPTMRAEASETSAARRVPSDGDGLLDVILSTVNASEVDMLASMLAAKRPDQPDLARRVKQRFDSLQNGGH